VCIIKLSTRVAIRVDVRVIGAKEEGIEGIIVVEGLGGLDIMVSVF